MTMFAATMQIKMANVIAVPTFKLFARSHIAKSGDAAGPSQSRHIQPARMAIRLGRLSVAGGINLQFSTSGGGNFVGI